MCYIFLPEVRATQLAVAFFRAKKARASGRNVGKVFNPVVKLVLENSPFFFFYLLSVHGIYVHSKYMYIHMYVRIHVFHMHCV